MAGTHPPSGKFIPILQIFKIIIDEVYIFPKRDGRGHVQSKRQIYPSLI